MSAEIIPGQAILESVKNGTGALKVVVPTKELREYTGCVFLDAKIQAIDDGRVVSPLFFSCGSVKKPMESTVLFNIGDGAQEAPPPKIGKGKPAAASSNLGSAVRDAISFDLGENSEMSAIVAAIDRDYRKQISTVLASQFVKAYEKAASVIGGPVVTHYSDSATDRTKRGKPLESPRYRVYFNYESYSDKYFVPSLAGKPKSTIYDWTSRRVVDGKYVYDELKDAEGETICKQNAGAIIKRGSIVRRAVLKVDGISVGKSGVHLRLSFHKLFIEASPKEIADGGDDVDEDDVAPPSRAAASSSSSTRAAAASSAASGDENGGGDGYGDDGDDSGVS